MIELEVVGINRETAEAQVLVLKERAGSRALAIWIAEPAAAAISAVLNEHPPAARPSTHDLLAELAGTLGESGQAQILRTQDYTFHGELKINGHSFDARPSDLVAMALRLGWPISCSTELMDEVGVEVDRGGKGDLERFMEFLDAVNPDDFQQQ